MTCISTKTVSVTVAGFTLIEMLVTLTVFSLVLGVLVSGFRVGANAYHIVDRHQRTAAETERAKRLMREDFRHMAIVSEGTPVIFESEDGTGNESVVLTSLFPRHRQQLGQTGVWQTVEYAVESDSGAFVRRATVNVAMPLENEPVRQVVLESVERVQFDYLTAEGASPVWTQEDVVPPAVQATVELESGKTFRWVFEVPLGMAAQVLNGQ